MLKVEQIYKSFKNNEVLKGVDLDVDKGELVYIRGINGSGKSTLFKIVCDVIAPDQGEIKLTDDEQIGALIENPGFVENENLQFNLETLASIKDNYNQEYIEVLCQRLQLDFHSKEAVKNYSVGMRQKLGIIQAIMEDQDVILFDEPTRGLDQESADEFNKIINELHKGQERIIIIASHENIDLPYTKRLLLEGGVLSPLESIEN